MQLFRALVMLLLSGAAVCFVLYIATSEVRYRQLGLVITKWTVLAALAFFAIVIAERML